MFVFSRPFSKKSFLEQKLTKLKTCKFLNFLGMYSKTLSTLGTLIYSFLFLAKSFVNDSYIDSTIKAGQVIHIFILKVVNLSRFVSLGQKD